MEADKLFIVKHVFKRDGNRSFQIEMGKFCNKNYYKIWSYWPVSKWNLDVAVHGPPFSENQLFILKKYFDNLILLRYSQEEQRATLCNFTRSNIIPNRHEEDTQINEIL